MAVIQREEMKARRINAFDCKQKWQANLLATVRTFPISQSKTPDIAQNTEPFSKVPTVIMQKIASYAVASPSELHTLALFFKNHRHSGLFGILLKREKAAALLTHAAWAEEQDIEKIQQLLTDDPDLLLMTLPRGHYTIGEVCTYRKERNVETQEEKTVRYDLRYESDMNALDIALYGHDERVLKICRDLLDQLMEKTEQELNEVNQKLLSFSEEKQPEPEALKQKHKQLEIKHAKLLEQYKSLNTEPAFDPDEQKRDQAALDKIAQAIRTDDPDYQQKLAEFCGYLHNKYTSRPIQKGQRFDPVFLEEAWRLYTASLDSGSTWTWEQRDKFFVNVIGALQNYCPPSYKHAHTTDLHCIGDQLNKIKRVFEFANDRGYFLSGFSDFSGCGKNYAVDGRLGGVIAYRCFWPCLFKTLSDKKISMCRAYARAARAIQPLPNHRRCLIM